MSNDYIAVRKLIDKLGWEELWDIKEAVDNAIEKKKNEDRTVLLQVRDSMMSYHHFREDEMEKAVAYLAKHVNEWNGDSIQIARVKIRNSEVEEKLNDDWFSFKDK